jgi:hypothetical protein
MSPLKASDLSPALAKRIGVPATKVAKYRAAPVWIDGIRFASQREARRYGELLALVKAGLIANVQVQPAYVVSLNGIVCCTYKADYRYQTPDGAWVVEDVKGIRTSVYKLKKRLVEAQYGIRIVEV